jgi:hypothetical protein
MSVEADTLNYYMRYFSEAIGAPPDLLMSIAMKESSYNPSTGKWRNVCNSVKACGLMQLRPIALADIKRVFKYNLDPLDPVQSIVGAACMFLINQRYIQVIAKINPSIQALVVAYNGGWTAGRFYMQKGYAPTLEGRNYIAFVAPRIGVTA